MKIGEIVGIPNFRWVVVGYLCEGSGIQAVGSSIEEKSVGQENREWVEGFNRTEEMVWEQIESLDIPYAAKKELGEKGVYPSNLLDVVGIAHDNWRVSIGKTPDYYFAKLIRGPQPLKTPCPF